MKDRTVCRKVTAMLSLYIDNKITIQEKDFIEEHLSACDECHKKYLYLKSLIKNLKDSYRQVVELAVKKQKQRTFSIREHEKFKQQLSPYVDNELDAKECFEFRKYLIKSKPAQKELKNTYTLQKEMRNAFNITKKNFSPSVSKKVINILRNKPKKFESRIVREIFTMRTAKIAILAGLIMIGAYEFKQIDTPLKEKSKQVFLKENTNEISPQNIENSDIKADSDFIRF